MRIRSAAIQRPASLIYLPIPLVLTYNDDDDDDVGSFRLPQQPNKRMIFEVLFLDTLQAKNIPHI